MARAVTITGFRQPKRLLGLATRAAETIHDDVLHVRARLEIAELEHAGGREFQSTLEACQRLILALPDPTSRIVLACDLAQTAARLGRDAYRILDFARTAALAVSNEAEIYLALIEAKLGYHADRRLRWAEQCATALRSPDWLMWTQAAIARIQAGDGKWIQARLTTGRINEPLHRLISECELAVIAHEQGDPWARDLLPTIDELSAPVDQVRALAALATAAWAMQAGAESFLRLAARLVDTLPAGLDRDASAIVLARALASCANVKHARTLADALPEPTRCEALLAICQATAETGNVMATRRLADQLMLPEYRSRALYLIVRSASRAAGRLTHQAARLVAG